MKRKSKICSMLLVLAMALSLVPNTSFAIGGIQETVNPIALSGVGTTGGAGKWTKSDAVLMYNGGQKNFSTGTNTYKVVPYKEITMLNEVLEDYEKLEFFLGYDVNATVKNPVNVRIIKENVIDGTRKAFDDQTIMFDGTEEAKKIEVALDGFDGVKLIFSMQGNAEACEFVVADMNLYKTTEERAERNSSFSNYVITYYGGYKQSVYASKQITVFGAYNPSNPNACWYADVKNLVTFDAGIYTAVEMDLGYDESKSTNSTGEYCTYRVFTRKGNADIANYNAFRIKRGESRNVVIPLPTDCTGIRVEFARYDSAGVQCRGTTGYTTPEGALSPAILNLKMYKNTKAASYYPTNSVESAFPKNVTGKAQYAEMSFTVNAKDYTLANGALAKGILISKQKGAISNIQDGRNGRVIVGTTYMTGKMYDRMQAIIAIPSIAENTTVAKTSDDYIKIIGCIYKEDTLHNLNTDANDFEVIYEAYAMDNNFIDKIDIDISKYDYIKLDSNMPCTLDSDGTTKTCCRYAGLFDVSFMRFGSTTISSSYNEDESVVTAYSPATRPSGSLIAVSYSVDENGHTEKGITFNNDVVFGEGTQTITRRDNATFDTNVIKRYNLDVSSIIDEASYIKVYYLDENITEAESFSETGATDEDLIATYMVSSEVSDITSIQSVSALTVDKGIAVDELNLPNVVSVYVNDIEYNGIGVNWTIPNYNSKIAGCYNAIGTLNSEDLMYRNLTNSADLKINTSITVNKTPIANELSNITNVDIGGGGFVTGLVFHPLDESVVYARTDVGGVYRYETVNDTWVPITEWLPTGNMFGIDAIAVDPQDVNTVYIAAGAYWYKKGHGLFKSNDKGETWTDISFTDDSRVFSANSVNRTAGEALLVDPTDSNIIYCGTRIDGLWITRDGGANWTKSSLPVTSLNNNAACTGIRSIASDASGNIYAGVYGYSDISGGVYMSTDKGESWNIIPNGPEYPLYIKTNGNDVYVSSGEAFSTTVAATFSKYDSATCSWVDMTPEGYAGAGAFDFYTNADDELVIWLAESKKDSSLYKKVGDSQWSEITQSDLTLSVTGTASWFKDRYSQLLGDYSYVGDLEIVSSNSGEAMWITDGGVGVWKNSDIESSYSFVSEVDGINELCVNAITVPATSDSDYNIISTNADFGMVVSTNDGNINVRSVSENFGLLKEYFGASKDVETCYGNSDYIVTAGIFDDGLNVVVSDDAGATWSKGDYYDAYGDTFAKLAVSSSADGGVPRIVMIPAGNSENVDPVVMVSDDFGESWMNSSLNDYDFTISSLTSQTYKYNIIDSDKVNGDVFYIYDPDTAYVYVSMDGGETFTGNYISLLANPNLNLDDMCTPTIKARPGSEGEVWVSNSKGLFKSTDYGATFEEVTSDAIISMVRAFDFGKGVTDETTSIFALGTVEGTFGLYRSDDDCATWIKINGNNSLEIAVSEIAGDLNVHGRVYVATHGRGIIQVDKGSETVDVEEDANKYLLKLNYTGTAVAIAASYDASNKLIDITMSEPKTIVNNGQFTIDKPMASDHIKIYVWESLENMTPIFGAIDK